MQGQLVPKIMTSLSTAQIFISSLLFCKRLCVCCFLIKCCFLKITYKLTLKNLQTCQGVEVESQGTWSVNARLFVP